MEHFGNTDCAKAIYMCRKHKHCFSTTTTTKEKKIVIKIMENLPEMRFHKNLVALGDLLYTLTLEITNKGYQTLNPTLVEFASSVIANYDKRFVIENFIVYSNEYWDKIRERNEEFFRENAGNIFKGIPLHNVNAFRDIFTLKDERGEFLIDPVDKKTVWDFFFALIRISLHYLNENPEFHLKKVKDLDLVQESKKWNLKSVK
jgi:hypothetical protein